MRALDTREHTTTTHLAAWQIDLGAWWVIDNSTSRRLSMCVHVCARCQKDRKVGVSETEKHNGHKVKIWSTESGQRWKSNIARPRPICSSLQHNPLVCGPVGMILLSKQCRQLKFNPVFIRLCPEYSLFKKLVHPNQKPEITGHIIKFTSPKSIQSYALTTEQNYFSLF